MAKKYLLPLSEIVEEALAKREDEIEPVFKHFFSGATLSVNRNTCINFSPAGFAVKLSQRDRDALVTQHNAKPLKFEGTGPVRREYVILPKPLLEDKETLHRWVNASIDFVINE
ncbi:MAG: TfoX/Sxy family protein [Pseudomonadota bacterium]